jgi:predicted regulator of Ras-like GTPase activity (Roadblock/LC7/MglB family)
MSSISETPATVLSTLRDVPGVIGSFVVSVQGDCIARDMAAMFTSDLLHDVGPRIMRLAQAFSAEKSEVMSLLVRYPEHALFIRGFKRGAVCVLSASNVNLPALKMGVTLSVRRLSSILEAVVEPAVVPTLQPRVPQPSAARPAVALPAMSHPSVPLPNARTQAPATGIRWRGGLVSKS